MSHGCEAKRRSISVTFDARPHSLAPLCSTAQLLARHLCGGQWSTEESWRLTAHVVSVTPASPRTRAPRQMVSWRCGYVGVRVGEASHPGPVYFRILLVLCEVGQMMGTRLELERMLWRHVAFLTLIGFTFWTRAAWDGYRLRSSRIATSADARRQRRRSFVLYGYRLHGGLMLPARRIASQRRRHSRRIVTRLRLQSRRCRGDY